MKSSLPSTISKVMTMAESTVRVQVDFQETTPEAMAEIFKLKGSLGWFFFHEKPITEIDTKDLPEIKLEGWEKSPSQRLRNTLFRLWEARTDQGKTKLPFETWYREQMEMLINQAKEKLD